MDRQRQAPGQHRHPPRRHRGTLEAHPEPESRGSRRADRQGADGRLPWRPAGHRLRDLAGELRVLAMDLPRHPRRRHYLFRVALHDAGVGSGGGRLGRSLPRAGSPGALELDDPGRPRAPERLAGGAARRPGRPGEGRSLGNAGAGADRPRPRLRGNRGAPRQGRRPVRRCAGSRRGEPAPACRQPRTLAGGGYRRPRDRGAAQPGRVGPPQARSADAQDARALWLRERTLGRADRGPRPPYPRLARRNRAR